MAAEVDQEAQRTASSSTELNNKRGTIDKIARSIDISKPGYLFLWILLLTVVFYIIGILLFPSAIYGSAYFYAFPVSLGVIITIGLYYNKSVGSLRIYLASMLIMYLIIAVVSSLPGNYLLATTPSTVQGFGNSIGNIRQTYTTIPSLSSEIFLNNIRIDLISYVPILGSFFLGYSIVNTGSLLWALSISYSQAHLSGWFLGLLAVIIAPDTFTEFSAYVLAAIGGIYLYRELTNKITFGSAGHGRGYLYRSLIFLLSSIGLLYGSALLEAFLIIKVGL
ncbi:MAG: hypothetical protein JRN53_01905 [Nitrososphaerota archaeon]|jgi:hypothetical protein|nr:hypothetical protein [Nitrososphaerota archaeon]MDG7040807.1 hypothetical protein [Nitrososphaerota archaeon]MDG7046324.1 hypothetical protein [Nitrososphaerota archaeon]MDG7047402.1 hypothetical protein [Nitrososphaerota archaeon]